MGVMARFFEKNEHILSSQHSIECGSCGKTEKFPTSKQRQESKVFEWLNNKGSYAYYKCRCGKQTLSKIVQIEICPNTCKEIEVTYEFSNPENEDIYDYDDDLKFL